ncbi:hypothetical protein ABIC83_002952 [Roseateles asaccharophilus]|uniref:hypothetical protein n=1 Tax=Roseateles asaccharophilus TaxID=582607 RepID=UPI0038394F4C
MQQEFKGLMYRLNGFDLESGNKAAGFGVSLPTDQLGMLAQIKVSEDRIVSLHRSIQARLANAKLLPKPIIRECGVMLLDGSACPRAFVADPVFGASIGADPGTLQRILDGEGVESFGPEIEYTPHNTDSAKQAIALAIIVATWAEWANHELLIAHMK